jgi:uncharacterized membrane protein (DUF4010 family)
LIGVVSFAGYIAVRTLGERRGLAISAAAGAMISSTAVTLGNSRLAAKLAGSNAMVAIAICLAWIVSLARMTIIAIAIDPQLLRSLAIPMGAAIAVFAVLLLYRRLGNDPARFDTTLFQNPLDLRFVLGFGSLLAGVFAGTKLLSAAFGQAGVLTLAGLTGFVDVDPITLSSARLSGTAIAVDAAAQAILLAGAANMVTKMAITVLVGGIGFGWKLVLAGALAIACGALVFVGIS